jgi:RNA polymerase sigma-70 factor (family 1)
MKIVYTDIELFEKFQLGDEDAIKELYNRHYQPLCFFADQMLQNKEEAEDVAVDSFLKLLRDKQQYGNLSKIKSFLFTTTHRACIDLLRRRKNRDKIYQEIEHLSKTEEQQADRELIIAKVMQVIYEEIENLPTKTREVFTSIFIEGKSTAIIAEEMGISPQTVLNQKTRALQILRTKLYEEGYQEPGLLLYCLMLLASSVEA